MAARVAVLAVLVALAAAAPAQARFVLGIGDQSTAMLDDARFTALGLTDTRIVVPYDVATDPVQLARYAPFLDAAHARGMRSSSRSERAPTHAPAVAAHVHARGAGVPRALPVDPRPHDVEAANHASQPTARHPGRAARLYNALRGVCRGCRIVAADVLDQAGFQRWIRTFRRTARRPTIWGLHNYVDVNRNRDVSVPRLRAATGGRGQVWLTGPAASSASRARSATTSAAPHGAPGTSCGSLRAERAARLPLPVDGRADRRPVGLGHRRRRRPRAPGPQRRRGLPAKAAHAPAADPARPALPRPPDAPPDTGGVEAPPGVG